MNAFARSLAPVALFGAMSLSLPATSLGAGAAGACKTLDPMRTSMIAKADQGADALRRYTFITRGIHQLDAMEVAGSIDAWRAEAGCARKTADKAAALPPVALLQP